MLVVVDAVGITGVQTMPIKVFSSSKTDKQEGGLRFLLDFKIPSDGKGRDTELSTLGCAGGWIW